MSLDTQKLQEEVLGTEFGHITVLAFRNPDWLCHCNICDGLVVMPLKSLIHNEPSPCGCKYSRYSYAGVPTERRAKHRELLYKYGIGWHEYSAMLVEQDNQCAICKADFSQVTPCVDHCHRTDKVRGLLCSHCNLAIGYLRDSSQSAMRASGYLSKN